MGLRWKLVLTQKKEMFNETSQQTGFLTHDTFMLRHIIKPSFTFDPCCTSSRRSQWMGKLGSISMSYLHFICFNIFDNKTEAMSLRYAMRIYFKR